MKKLFDGFFKTTVAGGVMFLVPLLVFLIVAREAIRFVGKLLSPIADRIPTHSVAGVAIAHLLAVGVMVLVAFLAGLAARTAAGQRFIDSLEQNVLLRVPGYTLLRSFLRNLLGDESDADVKPVLASIENSWQLGFLMEESPDGTLTVMIPSSPTPTQGSVYYMKERQIRRLDAPARKAMRCISQLGVGSHKVLGPTFAAKAAERPPEGA
jgi:uncharacterized membrane protein